MDKREAIDQILQQLLNDWCSAGQGKKLILESYTSAILSLFPTPDASQTFKDETTGEEYGYAARIKVAPERAKKEEG